MADKVVKKKSGFLKKTKQKVKKSFDIFKSKNHENQYSKLNAFLEKDLNDKEEEEEDDYDIPNNDVISIDSNNDEEDDYAAFKKASKQGDVILVDDYSDDDDQAKEKTTEKHDDTDSINKQTTEKSEEPTKQANELTDNTDFISLKFSDSEDGEEDENEHLSNDEDAYSMDDNNSHITTGKKYVNSACPWIKDHDHSTQKEISDWLTFEIRDFVAYISPSKDEIEMRNRAVRRLRENITEFWPDCEVHVFGSYATDLYLPGSDIDMVIVSKTGDYDNRSSLYSLSSFLKRRKLAYNVEVIAKTKVPIIKFVESESNIQIDVSFERTNGIEAAKIIRGWLNEVPALRELVLIVKQFLNIRKLNNVRLGGLGGYSTICMVYSFLKLHPRLSTGTVDAMENLGVLLIEFFELYGRDFGYDNVAICVDDDNVCYLNKHYYPDLRNDRSPFALSIQDPSDPSNNISRGSFNIRDIKKGFFGAFKLLVTSCYELEQMSYKERLGKSILGNVIKYKGTERDFSDERSLVVNEAMYDDDGRSIVSQVVFSEASSSENELDDDESDKENTVNKPRDDGKKVDDFMGLPTTDDDDDEADNNDQNKMKRQNSVDKDTKRDYWLQKGSTLNY